MKGWAPRPAAGVAAEPVHGTAGLGEGDPKIGPEVTARHRLDVSQEVIAHPITDNEIVGGQRDRVVGGVADRERSDPGGEFVITHHLPEVWEQLLPVVHPSRLAHCAPAVA